MIRLFALLALLAGAPLVAPPSLAATSPQEMLRDPALEARARALGRELRCLVCQNQSIDDSDADLARDLRRVVRERLLAGDGDGAIKDYLVTRYGEFVLLQPPMQRATWFLWFGPAAVLLLGAGVAVTFYRRREAEPAADLSPEERARLDDVLRGEGGHAS